MAILPGPTAAPMSSDDFAGVRVVVTGGTRGIGAAVAARFLAGGAAVLVAARTPVEPVPGLRVAQADLATAEGAARVADAAVELLGGVDVLVSNAGGHRPAQVLELTDEDWLHDLDLNLLAAVRLDRALLPGMIAQSGGSIVHITSGAARYPQPTGLAYAAAKAALTAYSKGLAAEVGRHGIRVNTVAPGFVVSAATDDAMAGLARQTGSDVAGAYARTVEHFGIPLARAGDADDVAQLVCFLASPAARYLTGAQFAVDGGLQPTV